MPPIPYAEIRNLPADRETDALVAVAGGWRWLQGELEPNTRPGEMQAALFPPETIGACYLLRKRVLLPADRDTRPRFPDWERLHWEDMALRAQYGVPPFSQSWSSAFSLLDVGCELKWKAQDVWCASFLVAPGTRVQCPAPHAPLALARAYLARVHYGKETF